MDITYVCPECGCPVTYTKIELSNGSFMNAMDWECKNCGACVFDLQKMNPNTALWESIYNPIDNERIY